ncbi:hypothetical protein QCA50_006166 [Cerrena zonata]|uniref:Glycosyl hydrolase family 13 catalytic domain-containing protein n=1 Tax=Cerrena zonata TaxID=2478898 RepID=A0AAW0GC87_9APHY
MMNFVDDLREWIRTTVLPYRSPALRSMRRGPMTSPPGPNPLMIQFFTWDSLHPDMSWWKHFESEVDNLADLGFTQVWLPPPNKAMVPKGQGYDAYDLWDLGEFHQKGTTATRWGTKEELIKASASAQARGIDILIDAVLNHKIGADRTESFQAIPVDADNRLKEIGPEREIEGWTAFDFPGRSGKYSEMKWTEEHFTGLDWDHRNKEKGVFRIVGGKHQGWSKWVDKELGNYDYLLGIDIDHRHPDVQKDLFAWGAWVLQTTGATGFRLDAIKHMDRRFLLDFIKHARKVEGRQNLFAVAEYWSANVELIKPYIRAFEGLMTFFDVPLHHRFHDASKAGSHYDLRTILDRSVVKIRPGDAVTFVDNHDKLGKLLRAGLEIISSSKRMLSFYFAKKVTREYSSLFRCPHVCFTPTSRSCVFYGDLYPNKECYNEAIASKLKQLILARKKFAYGTQRDYFLEHNCIGFVREGTIQPVQGSESGGCAVVLSIGDDVEGESHVYTLRMNVGKVNGGGKYRPLLDPGSSQVETAADGWGLFTCHKGSLEVWVQA